MGRDERDERQQKGHTYGPNSAQVERFLNALKSLTSRQWDLVFHASEVSRPGYLDATIGAKHTAHEVGLSLAANSALSAATGITCASLGEQRCLEFEGAQLMGLAEKAAEALVVRRLIDSKEFQVVYQPFAAVIPLESLENHP